MFFYVYLFCLIFTISCANLTDLDSVASNLNKKAYMPNLDLYVFRGGSSAFLAPDLNKDGIEDENIVNYVTNFFNNTPYSINSLQEQVGMTFYRSKIRIFFISTNQTEGNGLISDPNYPVLQNTYRDEYIKPSNFAYPASDKCPANLPSVPETSYSLCALDNTGQPILSSTPDRDRLVYIDNSTSSRLCTDTPTPASCVHKCFNGDLGMRYKFTLTDIAGKTKKGTVTVDSNTVRIFFAKTVSPCSSATTGVAGLSTVGSKDFFDNPNVRYYLYSTAISRDYTIGFGERDYTRSGDINAPKRRIIQTLSHELGHYFGLTHTFEESSCDYTSNRVTGATTNRIMDYNVIPEIFAPCEKIIVNDLSSRWLKEPITYSVSPNGSINYTEAPTVVSANIVGALNNENQTMLKEGMLEIYDGSWNGTLTINDLSNFQSAFSNKLGRPKIEH